MPALTSPLWFTVIEAPSTSISFEKPVDPLMWLVYDVPPTPGLTENANASGRRPLEKLSGSSSSAWLSSVVPTSGDSVWRRGTSAVTSMASAREPISTVASTRSTSVARKVTPLRTIRLKPCAAKVN